MLLLRTVLLGLFSAAVTAMVIWTMGYFVFLFGVMFFGFGSPIGFIVWFATLLVVWGCTGYVSALGENRLHDVANGAVCGAINIGAVFSVFQLLNHYATVGENMGFEPNPMNRSRTQQFAVEFRNSGFGYFRHYGFRGLATAALLAVALGAVGALRASRPMPPRKTRPR